MELKTVLEFHTKAIGGFTAVANLHSLQAEFHLIEPTFAVGGVYCAARNGRMRVDIFIDNVRVFSEGLSGEQGWQLQQDDKTSSPTSPEGRKALQNGVENQLFGLYELPNRGHQLKLMGQEVIDGKHYFVIHLTYADGAIEWRYINAATWP